MKKIIASLLLLVLTGCKILPKDTCGHVISEMQLFAVLRKDPYFANGVPPPGKLMRVEKDYCGYRLYIGISSPDSFGNETFIIDGQGKILNIISGD